MSVAFGVVFGVFVVAILALAVVAIRWAVRRDRVARARHAEEPVVAGPTGLAPGTAARAPDRPTP